MKSSASRKRKFALAAVLIFTFFLAASIALTWPLARDMSSRTLDLGIWGDNLGTIYNVWYFDYAGEHDLEPDTNMLIGYPFGVDLRGHSFPLSGGVIKQMSRLVDFVVAYNLFLLLGFPLSGLAMFALVYYLTGKYPASIICGFAFTFSSWHLARSAEHSSLAAIYCIPLFCLALFHFWRKRGILSALLLAAASVLAFFTDYHLGYFCAVIGLVWVIVMVVKDLRKTNTFEPVDRKTVLFLCAVVVVTAAVVLPVLSTIFYRNPEVFPEFGARGDIGDSIQNSSRLWTYVTPSYYNPFLGRLLRGFSMRMRGTLSFTESAAYLGIIPALLAVYALWRVWRKKNGRRGEAEVGAGEPNTETGEPPAADVVEEKGPGATIPSPGPGTAWQGIEGVGSKHLRPIITFAVTVAAVAFVLSLPPEWSIKGVNIPWLSGIQHYLVRLFRAYSRWSLVVIFAVILLAGVGWALLVGRKKISPGWTVVVVAVVLLLIWADFTISPPSRARELPRVPGVVETLRGLPASDAVVLYPLVNEQDYLTNRYLYYQTEHEHPMLNGTTRGTEADLYRLAVIGYASAYTPAVLKAMDIDYAVILPQFFAKGIQFDPGAMPPAYRLIEEAGGGFLYEVTAEPASLIPYYYSGFMNPSIFDDGKGYAPATSPVSELKLDTREEGVYELSFAVASPGMEREVTLKLDGVTVGSTRMPEGMVRLVVPDLELPEGTHTLTLETGQPPAAVEGDIFNLGGQVDAYLIIGDMAAEKTDAKP